MTEKEFAVAEGIGRGMPDRAIAEQLGISLHAVKARFQQLKHKTGAKSREQLGQWMQCELFLKGLEISEGR